MEIPQFIRLLELKSFVSGARASCQDEYCDVLLEEIEKRIEELVALEVPYELIGNAK